MDVEQSRSLDKLTLLHQPAEVRLVEASTDQRLDHALELVEREALGEELKDELTSEDEDEDEDPDEDEDEDRRIHGRELRRAWKLFNEGALAALEKQLPLHIRA